MQFRGVIIEESLRDKSVLSKVEIESSEVEKITEKHQTAWLKQWTLHIVLVDADKADVIAEELSKSFDYSHGSAWYADFKNDKTHYIVFKDKVFKIDRTKVEEYQAATDYGTSLCIPAYQVDFAPNVVQWRR